MKIAIDITQSIYGTGVSVYTKELVTRLVKNHPNDEFILFGGSLRRKKELEAFAKKAGGTSKIYPFPPTIMDFVWNSLHIVPVEKLIGQVDIIHTSDWTEPPSKIPKVTTVHDLVVFKYPLTSTNSIRNAHRKKLTWVIRESKKIIAVSESTKSDLISILRVPEEKIIVIPEGVEERNVPQPIDIQEMVKRRYKTGDEFIFALSTLEPRKNQQGLIEAYKIVKKTFPNLKLLISGKTGWGDKVEPVDGVIMPGYIPYSDLPGIYSACLACVHPAFYEGFGLTPLQAMACGAAVAVSNTSSLPEVVGKAGILFDPTSAQSIASGIINAIQDRVKLRPLSLEQAKKFSFDKAADRTYKVYQEVLQNLGKI
jgi:glycosyltransferase involved in cell wall biosynthesis